MTVPLSVSPAVPALLAGCEVGANPIIWSNDDFPELAGDLPLEVILREMKACGYAGSELGHAYPRTAEALGAALGRHGLKLVSGWHSTFLATRPLADEEATFRSAIALLKALGAPGLIVAECSHAVHGQRDTALGYGEEDRRRLTEPEWQRLVAGLARFVDIAAAEGLKVVYHHHMGTVIQTATELDQLLAEVPGLQLLLDPGHLAFAGIDPHAVMQRHGPRVAHVHLKSVRPEVVARARRERWSFCRAVKEGVFTIAGEGLIDYPALFRDLAAQRYRGWLVAEAEEDPAKVPAFEKAQRARAFVRQHGGV